MEPRFDGADWPGDHSGDFLIRQVLLMEKDEDEAIVGSKLTERPLELGGQVVGVSQPGAGVGNVLDQPCVREHRFAGAARQGGATAVGGDFQQPGSNWPSVIEPRHAPQGAGRTSPA